MVKNKLVVPFLKWVGGKRQLMPAIMELVPKEMTTYFEPFVGGGAVLFHLQPKTAVVNDFNTELINVYRVVKTNVDELIVDLRKHLNEETYFYQIRGLDRTPEFKFLTDVERASRIIYLNKTCFNGLYRVNQAGEFNAPFGKYKTPNIVNEPTLRAVHQYLNAHDIELLNTDYATVLQRASKNSFVYLDPPYYPLTPSANFTGYVQGGWDEQDQIRLRQTCDELHQRGIKFLQSNSASNFIKEQYGHYTVSMVKAIRSINSNGEKRGEIDEVLIRNY